jgi:hypothetical protein
MLFTPGVSLLSPVAYTVEVANLTASRFYNGVLTFDTQLQPSAQCIPNGHAADIDFPRGYLVAVINFPSLS